MVAKAVRQHVLWISSSDAQFRGITEGDIVRVFNGRGETKILARITERILPGVVSINEGAWYQPDETGMDKGGCPNVLTKDERSPGGAFITNTCLVQVEKLQKIGEKEELPKVGEVVEILNGKEAEGKR